MTEAQLDTERAVAAAKKIFDARNPQTDYASILVTLEHCVAAVLLIIFPDPQMAAKMLNEGLVQGIENRISIHHSKLKRPLP